MDQDDFNQMILKEVQEACKKGYIERFETPQQVHIVKESWTPETDLVTDALKLKRKAIENKYRDLIEDLYDCSNSSNNQQKQQRKVSKNNDKDKQQ